MKILVRMPNWLGDAVMATPALTHLLRHAAGGGIVLVGSPAVCAMFAGDPSFRAVVTDESKTKRLRIAGIAQLARRLRREFGPFDVGVALPNSISSRLLLKMCGARRRVGIRYGLRRWLLTDAIAVDRRLHQAEIYSRIMTGYLGVQAEAGPTRLHVANPHEYPRPAVGINPGAAYGSAKRWPPVRFAEVAAVLAADFDVMLFGSANEAEMADQIGAELDRRGVANYQNLAGRTSLPELLSRIAGLSLLVTNDSGPMHIAGALAIPTVAIFGSTHHVQTSQWRNTYSTIVRHEIECAPCMRRTCPLGHHACMLEIQPAEVIAAARELIAQAANPPADSIRRVAG